jgi:hypothetical protein
MQHIKLATGQPCGSQPGRAVAAGVGARQTPDRRWEQQGISRGDDSDGVDQLRRAGSTTLGSSSWICPTPITTE